MLKPAMLDWEMLRPGYTIPYKERMWDVVGREWPRGRLENRVALSDDSPLPSHFMLQMVGLKEKDQITKIRVSRSETDYQDSRNVISGVTYKGHDWQIAEVEWPFEGTAFTVGAPELAKVPGEIERAPDIVSYSLRSSSPNRGDEVLVRCSGDCIFTKIDDDVVATKCHGWENFTLPQGKILKRMLDHERSWTNKTIRVPENKTENITLEISEVFNISVPNSEITCPISRKKYVNETINITVFKDVSSNISHPEWVYDVKTGGAIERNFKRIKQIKNERMCPLGYNMTKSNGLKFCASGEQICSVGDALGGGGWATEKEGIQKCRHIFQVNCNGWKTKWAPGEVLSVDKIEGVPRYKISLLDSGKIGTGLYSEDLRISISVTRILVPQDGELFPESQISCPFCKAGKWTGKYGVGQKECVYCPLGWVGSVKSDPDRLLHNMYGTCDPCPANEISTVLGGDVCMPCEDKSWTRNLVGQTSCSPCLQGEIFPDTAIKNCEMCSRMNINVSNDRGAYSFVAGGKVCHDCAPGTFCHGGAQMSTEWGWWVSNGRNIDRDKVKLRMEREVKNGSVPLNGICLDKYSILQANNISTGLKRARALTEQIAESPSETLFRPFAAANRFVFSKASCSFLRFSDKSLCISSLYS